MTAAEKELLVAFELHSAERIRGALDAGVDATAPIDGKLPVDWLTEMYTRSPAFPACLRLLLDRGATLADPLLAPVLLDDAESVTAAARADPGYAAHRSTMVSAFTPLGGATLLHVAAEFGNAGAARALIGLGADVNAAAATDGSGMNGQTPLFHTVNSPANHCAPVMRLRLDAGARVDVRLAGITWGKGFEWETTCFDVTPVSYAQLGLLPQIHRSERDVYANVTALLEAGRRPVPPLGNVPNRYLRRDGA